MDGRLVFAKASGGRGEGLLHSAKPARRRRGGQLRSQNDQRENSAESHQGRLASVRAELLPTLPACCPTRGAGRHLNEPSWIPVYPAITALAPLPSSTRESDAMSTPPRLNDNPPHGLSAPTRRAGWHKSCTALLGATMLISLSPLAR